MDRCTSAFECADAVFNADVERGYHPALVEKARDQRLQLHGMTEVTQRDGMLGNVSLYSGWQTNVELLSVLIDRLSFLSTVVPCGHNVNALVNVKRALAHV